MANARFSGVLGVFLLREAAMSSFNTALSQRIVLQSILSIAHELHRGMSLTNKAKKKNDPSESSASVPNPLAMARRL